MMIRNVVLVFFAQIVNTPFAEGIHGECFSQYQIAFVFLILYDLYDD